MSDFSFNLCRSCPDNTFQLLCDPSKVTIQKLDSSSTVIEELVFIRSGLQIQGDIEKGIIALVTPFPPLSDGDIQVKNRSRVTFRVDEGIANTSGNCVTYDPSATYTETLNNLTHCIESCCGGVVSIVSSEIIEAGTLNTPLVSDIAEVGDGCPEVNGVAQPLTYVLLAGSEVGGTLVLAPVGTYTFTPTNATTSYMEAHIQVLCDGTPVGSKILKVNLS